MRSFHRLTRFYQRFLKDFSKMATLIAKVIKKDIGFKWGEEKNNAFQMIKQGLTNTTLLCDALVIGIEL